MTAGSVNLSSTEAIRVAKTALLLFLEEVQDALTNLEIEARRPLQWIENDRPRYWAREVRRASDDVSEKRIAFNRCELLSASDIKKTCIDERKALEKAKRRQQTSEIKLNSVRQWRIKLKRDVEAFQVQISKVRRYLELDLAEATAHLENLATAIDNYVAVQMGEGRGLISVGGTSGPSSDQTLTSRSLSGETTASMARGEEPEASVVENTSEPPEVNS